MIPEGNKSLSNLILVLSLAVSSIFLGACDKQPKQDEETSTSRIEKAPTKVLAQLSVTNPSRFDRTDQIIEIDNSMLGLNHSADLTKLAFFQGDQSLPQQFVDTDKDGTKDRALLLLNLPKTASLDIELRNSTDTFVKSDAKRTHAEVSVKSGGHWDGKHYEGGVFQSVNSITVPDQYTDHSEFIRYEGPGIESDLIAYRIYLDWRNGFDIFAKQKYGLHLAEVGLDGYDSYHELADWGMDVLKVGSSVGVGGFGYWDGKQIHRVSDVKDWTATVLEDGPLFSSFEIDYQGWKIDDKQLDVNARFSMTAGSRLANVELTTSEPMQEIATGIVKHPNTEVLRGNLDITGEAWSYIASLGTQSLDGRRLAMFMFFKKDSVVEQTEDEYNYVVLMRPEGHKLSYYFGALWEGEPGANLDREAVVDMLEKQAEELTLAPRIQVRNSSSEAAKKSIGGTSGALQWAERVTQSEIDRHGNELAAGNFDSMRGRESNWEYTTGLLTQAVYKLGATTGNKSFTDWASGIIDSYVTEAGELLTYKKSDFNIDSINSGKMLLQRYRDTREEKYRLAADKLREQLKEHPRLDAGAFWHKARYPFQLWLDGIYMGMPFLAEYSVLFEKGHALDEVVNEFRVARDKLRDPDSGLYFHAIDEKKQQVWADPETGRSKYFWGRGMGWLAMALVDTLDFIPPERADIRSELSDMTRELADALLKYQSEDGVWFQIVDRPDAAGNYKESSASAMFTYMLVKGVTDGVLPDSYRAAAMKSYDGLINNFILVDANNSVHITQACQVAGLGLGRDGSYAYYMSEPVINDDPKVLGPFILLGPLVKQLAT